MKEKIKIDAEEIKSGLERLNINRYQLFLELDVTEPTFKKYVRDGFPVVYRNELVRLGIIAGKVEVRSLTGETFSFENRWESPVIEPIKDIKNLSGQIRNG